eukprot:TRINITY_DN7769_c0_g1_i1.p1 TRINITY_DN7769_c0_g1~~TRINITY_DN7769_c0_g1_i1.p1  ORF type:complete len:1173 (-),score=253.61 TRINITY_DN7769_c0_g1_i1:7-3525(-)
MESGSEVLEPILERVSEVVHSLVPQTKLDKPDTQKIVTSVKSLRTLSLELCSKTTPELKHDVDLCADTIDDLLVAALSLVKVSNNQNLTNLSTRLKNFVDAYNTLKNKVFEDRPMGTLKTSSSYNDEETSTSSSTPKKSEVEGSPSASKRKNDQSPTITPKNVLNSSSPQPVYEDAHIRRSEGRFFSDNSNGLSTSASLKVRTSKFESSPIETRVRSNSTSKDAKLSSPRQDNSGSLTTPRTPTTTGYIPPPPPPPPPDFWKPKKRSPFQRVQSAASKRTTTSRASSIRRSKTPEPTTSQSLRSTLDGILEAVTGGSSTSNNSNVDDITKSRTTSRSSLLKVVRRNSDNDDKNDTNDDSPTHGVLHKIVSSPNLSLTALPSSISSPPAGNSSNTTTVDALVTARNKKLQASSPSMGLGDVVRKPDSPNETPSFKRRIFNFGDDDKSKDDAKKGKKNKASQNKLARKSVAIDYTDRSNSQLTSSGLSLTSMFLNKNKNKGKEKDKQNLSQQPPLSLVQIGLFSTDKSSFCTLFSNSAMTMLQTLLKILEITPKNTTKLEKYKDMFSHHSIMTLSCLIRMTQSLPKTTEPIESTAFNTVKDRIINELNLPSELPNPLFSKPPVYIPYTMKMIYEEINHFSNKLYYCCTHLLSVLQNMDMKDINQCLWLFGLVSNFGQIVKETYVLVEKFCKLYLLPTPSSKSSQKNKIKDSKNGIGSKKSSKNGAMNSPSSIDTLPEPSFLKDQDKADEDTNSNNGGTGIGDPVDLFRAGTTDQLIVRLTSELNGGTEDDNLHNIFITWWPYYSNPDEIWDSLYQRFMDKSLDKETSQKVKESTARLIAEWVNSNLEFVNPSIFEKLKSFSKTLNQSLSTKLIGGVVNETLKSIENAITVLNYVTEPEYRSHLPIYCLVGLQPHKFLLYFDPEEIAKQITLIDSSLYNKIQWRELVGLNWMKKDTEYLSSNVAGLMHRLELLSRWISTSILLQNSTAERAEILTRIVNLLQALETLNNFHSLVGVVSGLNIAGVSNKIVDVIMPTLTKKTQEMFKYYSQMCEPMQQFKNLKEMMTSAGPSSIPYLGMYLGELIVMDEAYPSFVTNNDTQEQTKLINFTKYKKQNERVNHLLNFQVRSDIDTRSENIIEPLYTMLYILPVAMNAKELYSFSQEAVVDVSESSRED